MKLEESKIKIFLMVVIIVIAALSFFFNRGFSIDYNDIEKESLNYINNEILEKMEADNNARISQINRVLFGEYTHYITAHHEKGVIKGRRLKDGSYEFKVDFNQ